MSAPMTGPEAADPLAAQALRELADPGLAAVLGELLDRPAAGVDTAMHPACQMLGHSLAAHRDAGLAVSQYFAVALQQEHCVRQLLERLFADASGAARRDIDLLDFACGYGRLLRLLVHHHPPARIWAAEIQPEAVAHVAARYGVHGLASPPSPEDFVPGRRFDFIWVASLFSHLPDGLFQRWLARLTGLLTPNGVLCFSVHDEALLPGHLAMPPSGLHFIGHSENAGLDASIYGTTFVTADYVRRAVDGALGATHRCARLPRLLAHEQDVYVLPASPTRDLGVLDGLQRGLRGWLDRRALGADGLLHLEGWAGSIDPPQDRADGCHVELRIGDGDAGAVQRVAIDGESADVAQVLGLPHLKRCRWSARIAPPAPGTRLTLRVVDHHGRAALIYSGIQ